jgi:hypothetical protein
VDREVETLAPPQKSSPSKPPKFSEDGRYPRCLGTITSKYFASWRRLA